MKTPRGEIGPRMRDVVEACEQQGFKMTHQRMEILRIVLSAEEHPDAASVHRRVKKRIPTVSLDTVYRNLKLFAEKGLLSIVGLSQEKLRFDGNRHSHHHFVCMKCGMIRDISSEVMGDLEVPDEVKVFGSPVSVHLEVRGVCAACQRQTKRREGLFPRRGR